MPLLLPFDAIPGTIAIMQMLTEKHREAIYELCFVSLEDVLQLFHLSFSPSSLVLDYNFFLGSGNSAESWMFTETGELM